MSPRARGAGLRRVQRIRFGLGPRLALAVAAAVLAASLVTGGLLFEIDRREIERAILEETRAIARSPSTSRRPCSSPRFSSRGWNAAGIG